MVRQKSDGSKLSCYHKALIASAVFSYWTVKEKAIAIGRLKNTRTPAFFDSFDGKVISDHEAKLVSGKITAMVNREHYANLSHVIENEPFFKNLDRFQGVDSDSRRSQIKIRCTRQQAVNNNVMRMLHNGASNLQIADLQKFFWIHDSAKHFSFVVESDRAKSYESEFQNLETFITKVKNTVALVDRVAPLVSKITDLETHTYYYSSADKARIRFTFASASEPTAELILSAKIEAFKAGDESKVFASAASPHEIKQQAITSYINEYIKGRN